MGRSKLFAVLLTTSSIVVASSAMASTNKEGTGRAADKDSARVQRDIVKVEPTAKANETIAKVDRIVGARNLTVEARTRLIEAMSHPDRGAEITKNVELALNDIHKYSSTLEKGSVAGKEAEFASAKRISSIRRKQIEGLALLKIGSKEGSDAEAAEVLFTKVPGKLATWDAEIQENVNFLMKFTLENLRLGDEQGSALNKSLKEIEKPADKGGRSVKIEKASDIARMCGL